MNGADRLERELAVWFEDTAVPTVPDYVDEIARKAVARRQRPRWTFVGRYLPSPIAGIALPSGPTHWRAIGVVAALLALLAAGAIFVGSRPRIPPPFGPATNGLVIVTRNGDIVTFDPASGVEVPLLTGPEDDVDPMWSPDGTRFAFVRNTPTNHIVGFAGRDGSNVVLSQKPLANIDTDSITWKPDGSGVAALSGSAFYFIDAATGAVSTLALPFPDSDVVWRPPDGRELIYRRLVGEGPGALVLYSLDDGTSERLVARGPGQLRPRGWSPDGKRFIYFTTLADDRPGTTYVLDLETRGTVTIDAAASRLSNDGLWIAGYSFQGPGGRLCVAPATGGPCKAVGNTQLPDITHGDALNWSPDDKWLIVFPSDGDKVILVDAFGVEKDIVIPAQGAGSWQRTAP
jgi:sugar lactone lactonase YvrE